MNFNNRKNLQKTILQSEGNLHFYLFQNTKDLLKIFYFSTQAIEGKRHVMISYWTEYYGLPAAVNKKMRTRVNRPVKQQTQESLINTSDNNRAV